MRVGNLTGLFKERLLFFYWIIISFIKCKLLITVMIWSISCVTFICVSFGNAKKLDLEVFVLFNRPQLMYVLLYALLSFSYDKMRSEFDSNSSSHYHLKTVIIKISLTTFKPLRFPPKLLFYDIIVSSFEILITTIYQKHLFFLSLPMWKKETLLYPRFCI